MIAVIDEISLRWLVFTVGALILIAAGGRVATWIVLTRKQKGEDA